MWQLRIQIILRDPDLDLKLLFRIQSRIQNYCFGSGAGSKIIVSDPDPKLLFRIRIQNYCFGSGYGAGSKTIILDPNHFFSWSRIRIQTVWIHRTGFFTEKNMSDFYKMQYLTKYNTVPGYHLAGHLGQAGHHLGPRHHHRSPAQPAVRECPSRNGSGPWGAAPRHPRCLHQ